MPRDELCVTAQGGTIWVATAMSVFSRLCVGGEASTTRDKGDCFAMTRSGKWGSYSGDDPYTELSVKY